MIPSAAAAHARAARSFSGKRREGGKKEEEGRLLSASLLACAKEDSAL